MDTLDRLYRRLVDTLRREHPEPFTRPLTIAEIYQGLVPYRAVRSELGFSELAEYEHTLLRLLAGERDYLHVEMPQVGDDFRRELRSSNPILGLYRDYAAVGVRVNAAAAPPSAETDAPPARPEVEPEAVEEPIESLPLLSKRKVANELGEAYDGERPGGPGRVADSDPAASARSTAPPPDFRVRFVPAPSPPNGADTLPRADVPRADAPRAGNCRSCHEPLPEGRDIRFCPFCGESQYPVPCRACSTPLEPEWNFCILCGEPRRPEAGNLA